MTRRGIWGNIQFEGDSIVPGHGEGQYKNPKTEYSPIIIAPTPRNAIIDLLYDSTKSKQKVREEEEKKKRRGKSGTVF